MGTVRIGTKERDKRCIKEELMRYHLYERKIEALKEEIRLFKIEYSEILNDPPIGGSVIKMPDGAKENQNLVMRLEGRLNDLESNLQYYINQVHRLNNWLTVLTADQYRVIMKYVCEYQCQERSHAALELKCSEDNVKDRMNDGIERIRKKFNEFL